MNTDHYFIICSHMYVFSPHLVLKHWDCIILKIMVYPKCFQKSFKMDRPIVLELFVYFTEFSTVIPK